MMELLGKTLRLNNYKKTQKILSMFNKILVLGLVVWLGTVGSVFGQIQIQRDSTPTEYSSSTKYGSTLLGYNIYRNNVKLNDELVSELVYQDTVPNDGTFNYYVTAMYNSGESGSSNSVSLIIDQNAVTRNYVVFEEGTGTWCVYCPAAANGYADLVAAGKQVLGIAYHSNDDFENSDAIDRINYYRLSNFPTAVFDGVEKVTGGGMANESNYSSYLPVVEERMEVPTSFIMGISGSFSDTSYSAQVTIEKVATNNNTDLRLIGVLVENHIEEDWMDMTEVNEVARDVMPTSDGVSVDFDSLASQTVDLTFTLDSSWVKSNCKLIAFLQDYQTQEIFQACEINIDDFTAKISYTKAAELETHYAPYNLVADYRLDEPYVTLSWDNPGDERWLQWDNGINTSSMGNGSIPLNFDVAARWELSDLSPLEGMAITKIAFYPKDATCAYTLKIWEGDTGDSVRWDSVLSSVTEKEWNEIVLSNKVLIDVSKELWVGYNNNNVLNRYSAGIDAGPAIVGKGDKIRVNNNGSNIDWWNLSEAGLSGNWNIKFFVEPVQTTLITEVIQPEVFVYPNPSAGSFEVASDTEIQALAVISVNGQVVYAVKPFSKNYRVNLVALNPGIYFLKVTSANGYSFEKLIIE
jgi:hypothetical protein